MNDIGKNLEILIQEVEKKEKKLRKKSFYYSLVPIILAGILILYTNYRIKTTRQELNIVKQKVKHFRNEADSLKVDIEKLEERLRQSTEFVRNVYQIDWGKAKYIASRYPRQSEILFHILRLRDEGLYWKLGGRSTQEGFDSPSFCAHILNEFNLIADPLSNRYQLMEYLPPIQNPRVGDLIFYDNGYTMFFFKDMDEHEFCIGMTPVGIVSLEIDFGPKIISYRKINY